MNRNGDPTGDSGIEVQVLFAQHDEDLVTLDLIALQPFQWGTAAIEGGMPFTVSVNVPTDVSRDIMRIVDPWTQNNEILNLDVRPNDGGETVLMVGQHDRLFLEFFYPQPGAL